MHPVVRAILQQSGAAFIRYGKAYFDGNGDYLTLVDSTDWDFGTGNLTIELKVSLSDVTSVTLIEIGNYNASQGIVFDVSSSGKLTVFINGDHAITESETLSTNTIYDLALVRNVNTWTLYRGGVSKGTLTYSGAVNTSQGVRIGTGIYDIARYITGHFYGVRITKEARYTSDYTPPAYFENDANTVLCMNFGEAIGATTFIDDTGKTVTTNGNVVIVE